MTRIPRGRHASRSGKYCHTLAALSSLLLGGAGTTALAAPAGTLGLPSLLDPAPATFAPAPVADLLAGDVSQVTGPTLVVADASTTTSPAPLPKFAYGGSLSGLPWASGGTGSPDAFEAYRGRRLDVRTGYLTIRYGWTEMTQLAWVDQYVTPGNQPVFAVGLLPESARGQLAQCANGDFDAYIREIGQDLVMEGAGNAILRLGWEANRMGDFPWAVTSTSGPEPYKACFRRWVDVLRTVPGQSFSFDWNMGAQGNLPYHVDQIYPGNDYVDIIGVQYYDRCPPALTQADWDKRYNSYNTTTGSPYGLGKWLAYARSKGKRLSVPEWGIGGPSTACARPGVDNPFFIQKMWQFFTTNADSIAYEAYFNGTSPTGSYQLYPADANPLSSAQYKALWGPTS